MPLLSIAKPVVIFKRGNGESRMGNWRRMEDISGNIEKNPGISGNGGISGISGEYQGKGNIRE